MNTSYATNIQEDMITFIIFNPEHPRHLQQFTAHKDDVNPSDWETLRNGLLRQDISPDEAIRICSFREEFSRTIQESGNNLMGIQVINGRLHFNGQECRNSLAERVLNLFRLGMPIEPWIRFAEKVYRNPRPWVADELDLWLAASDLPITPDGDMIAYKKVRGDYKDIYTGTMDNSPGRVVSVPEEVVDPDRNNTCSTGLHFCSKSYLPHFGSNYGSRVVLVKINPEHIVSIPSDYDNAKGRTWRYEVVGEIEYSEVHEKVWEPVSMDYGTPEKARIVAEEKPEEKSLPPLRKEITIPGVGYWEVDYSYSCFFDYDLEDILYVGEENDRLYIYHYNITSHTDPIYFFFEEYFDFNAPESEDEGIPLLTRDRREAILIGYWIANFDPDRPLLSSNIIVAESNLYTDRVAEFIEATLPKFNVEKEDGVITVTRSGRSTRSIAWKLILALLDMAQEIADETVVTENNGGVTRYIYHDANGTTIVSDPEWNEFGVAFLMEGDKDDPEAGVNLATLRYAGWNPNPNINF